jgi:hypothetical protein
MSGNAATFQKNAFKIQLNARRFRIIAGTSQNKQKVKRTRIDTILVGVSSPPYDIENNTLTNTTLHLKASNINRNSHKKKEPVSIDDWLLTQLFYLSFKNTAFFSLLLSIAA